MPSAASTFPVTSGASVNWTKLNASHVPNGMCTCRIRTTTVTMYMAFAPSPSDEIAYTPTSGTDPYYEMPAGSVFEFQANPQLIRIKGASANGSANVLCSW